MLTVNRWSNTALYDLELCGERFRRRWVEGEHTQQSASMARGSSVHTVAAEEHKLIMTLRGAWDGAPPRVSEIPGTKAARDEAADLAADEFEARRRDAGFRFTSDDREKGEQRVVAMEKDTATKLASIYAGIVAPNVRPVAVERKVIVTPQNIDIIITGIIDLVEAVPGGEAVTDIKTATKSPSASDADTNGQLTMYAMLRGLETGVLPERVGLVHLIRTAGGNTSVVRQDSQRDGSDVNALVARLNVGIEAVKRGVFMPNTRGWHCSQRYCAFFDTCPYPERGRR